MRTILHSDMNNCYASIELLHHPELRGRPLAVGGDPEARHGIVLAKDQLAKKAGVKTGMALWQARQVCPNIIFVPPHMDLYLRFSRLAHEMYAGRSTAYKLNKDIEPHACHGCGAFVMPIFVRSAFRHILTGRSKDYAQKALVLRQISVADELRRNNNSIQFGGYDMIYKYEMACKEAGLSEEQTAEIRRFFDAEKKRMKRDKDAREEAGITFSYIQSADQSYDGDSDMDELDFLDENYDLEEIILHKILLEQLREALKELSVDDREFLLAVYDGFGAASRYAKQHGLSEMQVSRRKKDLIEQLRKKFFEKD